MLKILACLDSVTMAASRRQELDVPRNIAAALGRSAVEAAARGHFLGAWGCGAFGNDAHRTATDFRHALENDFSGAFTDVVFAITDWSPERKFLGPFREAFAPDDK